MGRVFPEDGTLLPGGIMDYLFVGLIAILGVAVLLGIAVVIRGFLRSTDRPDGQDRAGERLERRYPLRNPLRDSRRDKLSP
jgi:hypothetical protein